MKTLLIVWHSRTGGSRQMASAAADGARHAGDVEVRLIAAEDATEADVLTADGYIFAAPENLAALSGTMKEFFDRTYYALVDRANGRPYAAMICAGTDGTNAVRQLERIATGWRLRRVAEPIIIRTGAQDADTIWAPKTIGAEDLLRCTELGAALAAGIALGIF